VHPHLAGLLERARDAERGRRHGDPPLFHRRGEAAHHHLAHRDGDAPPGSGWISYDGRPTAAPQRGSTGQVIGVH
jgi:hypothetical protein